MLALTPISEEALSGGGEFIGLRAATQRFPGLAYSSLRAYVHSGRLKALRGPNDRIWLRVSDIENLYTQIVPKSTTNQGV
jgi:hypothetical protein